MFTPIRLASLRGPPGARNYRDGMASAVHAREVHVITHLAELNHDMACGFHDNNVC